MASIGRKEPASSPPAAREQPRTRTVSAVDTGPSRNPVGRLQTSVDNILAELRKVTWPTREETRNLTIVVLGISISLGLFLGGIDLILSNVYRLLNP
ncbi:MAG: preprotein translocase subunit SecE [Chloroflexia bacterium]